MKQWQTKDELVALLAELVEIESITGSPEEIRFPEHVHALLEQKHYFQQHPSHLQLHPLKDGRQLLTALVKKSDKKDTIILLSHFDVVGTEDFGTFQHLATKVHDLTAAYMNDEVELPAYIKGEIQQGEWLFGRGTMDMKAGLAIHLSMLERAMDDSFDGNILLLTVPDEEVNSAGMLRALEVLQQLQTSDELVYKLCMNGEPVFSKYPGDTGNYMYSGSIGKVLPGFFCYGKETHVGEPFGGLNANLMISYLSQELELQESFIEEVDGEVTPPPVSLMLRDLKEAYSVQTPVSAVTMYNVLFLEQSIQEINTKLKQAMERAARKIETHYQQKANLSAAKSNAFQPIAFKIKTMFYEELYAHAVNRFGKAEVERRQNRLVTTRKEGDRDFSTKLVKELVSMCHDLAPVIVLFYSPPFYPAVSSKKDVYIQKLIADIQSDARSTFSTDLTEVQFFPGLSDSSFIGKPTSKTAIQDLISNMPLQQKGFTLPADLMKGLQMPVLHLGPYGKDAHQWTERLEVTYSFGKLPDLMERAIRFAFRT
ncbi:Arginine utilization protein RocB [Terribacillus saccharophilus]|uniref:Arginine utilization protein RocB n=1 Tax=Terribacillus saccharophilus TaxID=361277 RepID=A0AAX2EAX9_9BACI|nr:M20/M25/M40 family metallo-hydrolase [Terribacillus saccharophilus]MEC0290483.1 M20/M25/M40 family metallo-hydrolase [Terribacillus saccharophilus]SEM60181.1 Arginine utilization protein RocB [Terribacillus saccharophilus]